jgi:hypothetical protein
MEPGFNYFNATQGKPYQARYIARIVYRDGVERYLFGSSTTTNAANAEKFLTVAGARAALHRVTAGLPLHAYACDIFNVDHEEPVVTEEDA